MKWVHHILIHLCLGGVPGAICQIACLEQVAGRVRQRRFAKVPRRPTPEDRNVAD